MDLKSFSALVGPSVAFFLFYWKIALDSKAKKREKINTKNNILYLIKTEIQWNIKYLEELTPIAVSEGLPPVWKNLETENKDASWHIVMNFTTELKYLILSISMLYSNFKLINLTFEKMREISVGGRGRPVYPTELISQTIESGNKLVNSLQPFFPVRISNQKSEARKLVESVWKKFKDWVAREYKRAKIP